MLGPEFEVLNFTELFHPRRIAVVGASSVKAPGRYDHIDWLQAAGFTGELYPVNPRYTEVHGLRCYPSLADLPFPIDLAIIMIPAAQSVEALRAVAPGKIKFAVIISSGFGELARGDLERELLAVAQARGIRVIGPNCMGIYSREGKVTQAPHEPFGNDPGTLATIAQSGGHSVNFLRASLESGIIVERAVSIGNQCDLTIEDFLSDFALDKRVRTIAAYIEDLKKPQQFRALAKHISSQKPLIVWKGGMTPQGAKITASHTGALAVAYTLWEGFARQLGIIPADNLHDIFNLCRALEWDALPQGPGVALLCPGGATSIYMTDCAIQAGLTVPNLSAASKAKLARFIAEVNTIIDNPLDVGLTNYVPDSIRKTIEIAAQDEAIHSIVVYFLIYPFDEFKLMLKSFVIAIDQARRATSKPVYVALYRPFTNFPEADETKREAIHLLNQLRIPYAMDLENCVTTIKRMVDFNRYRQCL